MNRLLLPFALVVSVLLTSSAVLRAAEDEPQEAAAFLVVDLQPKANQKLNDDFHGYEGNNLKPLPRGRQKLAEVEFDVGEKFIQLAGKRAPDFPEKVAGIDVGLKAQQVHFLHATGWGSPGVADGTEIGHFTLHYDDDTSETMPIVYGEDVRDWWALGENDAAERADVAFRGVNDASKNFRGRRVEIRLFKSTWKNPHPEKQIASIDFVSKNETICSPFLVAISIVPPADEAAAVEALKVIGGFVEKDSAGRVRVVSLSGPGPVSSINRGSDTYVELLAGLPMLEKAYLNSPGIGDEGIKHLAKLQNLRWLSLNLSNVTDAGLEHLKNLKNLERLRLHETPITDEGLSHIGHLKNLQILDVSQTPGATGQPGFSGCKSASIPLNRTTCYQTFRVPLAQASVSLVFSSIGKHANCISGRSSWFTESSSSTCTSRGRLMSSRSHATADGLC